MVCGCRKADLATVSPSQADGRCRHYIDGIRAQYHSEPVPQPPAVMPVAYVK